MIWLKITALVKVLVKSIINIRCVKGYYIIDYMNVCIDCNQISMFSHAYIRDIQSMWSFQMLSPPPFYLKHNLSYKSMKKYSQKKKESCVLPVQYYFCFQYQCSARPPLSAAVKYGGINWNRYNQIFVYFSRFPTIYLVYRHM